MESLPIGTRTDDHEAFVRELGEGLEQAVEALVGQQP